MYDRPPGSLTTLSLATRPPLRILHVAPYAADAWAYGGIPRLLGSLTRGLARRGHSVTVCATDACDERSRLPKRAVMADPAGGVELRIFPNLSNRLAYRLQLFLPSGLHTYLSEHARSFDVAHLHACRNVPGVIAAHHLRRAGVPYVLAPNGTAPRIERRRLAKRAFDLVVGQRMLDGASRVIAVTDAERTDLLALGVARSSLSVVPNPVDLEEFANPIQPGTFRRRVGLPDRTAAPVVMFLGKITPRKRVDVLVRAFAALERRDARLVIAGNDMGTRPAVTTLVRSLGLERRTLVTGLLRGRERLDALADADVVVYPSQQEVFGLVPLEALLCGTPVVVCGDSGCGEVVRRVGGGSVVPTADVSALTRAIDDTLQTPDRHAIEAAASRIRNAYSTDVVCGEIERVYHEVVAS
jgi:glycosyltransferase involved in cell wall biosynthesis